MIPILYESTETAFIYSGICRLTDCTYCVVTEERNGIYECDFDYPITGAYYDKIQCGRIIGVRHDDSKDIQPFDIVSYSRPLDGVVSFHAVHISYRQTELVVRGTGINGITAAFNLIKNSSTPSNPFTYNTDISSSNYMAAADGIPRSVRQMLGGVEGSILDSYGGEYEFDKWTVNLWKARGELKEVTIRYGLNMVNYNEDVDYYGTYTSCIPYWAGDDGAGGTKVVVGSKVDSGATAYNERTICVPLDLTSKFQEAPTTTQLQNFALSQMQSQNVALPKQNISVDFVNLAEIDEYSQLAELMKCSLCDQVNVVFPRYNMQGTFKIVKTVYDVLKERFTQMELGHLQTSLSEAMGISNNDLLKDGGATIEHGDNSYGSYWKFPDGLLICTKKWSGTVTMATSYGGHYETADAVSFGNWAYNFVSAPTVTASCGGSVSTVMAIVEKIYGTSTSAVGSSYLMSPTSRTSVSVTVNIIGIGQWK